MKDLLRIARTQPERRVLLALTQNPQLGKSNKFKTIAMKRRHMRVLRYLTTQHPTSWIYMTIRAWSTPQQVNHIFDTYVVEKDPRAFQSAKTMWIFFARLGVFPSPHRWLDWRLHYFNLSDVHRFVLELATMETFPHVPMFLFSAKVKYWQYNYSELARDIVRVLLKSGLSNLKKDPVTSAINEEGEPGWVNLSTALANMDAILDLDVEPLYMIRDVALELKMEW